MSLKQLVMGISIQKHNNKNSAGPINLLRLIPQKIIWLDDILYWSNSLWIYGDTNREVKVNKRRGSFDVKHGICDAFITLQDGLFCWSQVAFTIILSREAQKSVLLWYKYIDHSQLHFGSKLLQQITSHKKSDCHVYSCYFWSFCRRIRENGNSIKYNNRN